jgi:hypothetical protein
LLPAESPSTAEKFSEHGLKLVFAERVVVDEEKNSKYAEALRLHFLRRR